MRHASRARGGFAIFVGALTWMWLKERPTRLTISSVLLVVFAAIVITADDHMQFTAAVPLTGSLLPSRLCGRHRRLLAVMTFGRFERFQLARGMDDVGEVDVLALRDRVVERDAMVGCESATCSGDMLGLNAAFSAYAPVATTGKRPPRGGALPSDEVDFTLREGSDPVG